MSAGPAVTVVVPVWDEYVSSLVEAVDSVGRSAHPAEILVVDNASRVPLPALPGATVVRTAGRMSTGAARNLGLEHVRTPYVLFLDADDVLVDGALDLMLAATLRDPAAVAWAFGIIDGNTMRPYRLPRSSARVLSRVPLLFALVNASWSLLTTQGATLLSTEAVRQVGGYGDADHGEDWEVGAALGFAGRISMSTHPALIYHWHAASPGAGRDDPPVIAAAAARVRTRLRSGDLPGAARAALPLVAGLQFAALYVARPLVRLFRGASRFRSNP